MTTIPAKFSPRNRILNALPRDEYDRVQLNLQRIQLPRGRVVYEAGDLAEYAYFPLTGVISLLSSTEAGEVIEVGMVGNEGTTGMPVIAHAQEMPFRALVQLPVEALRMETRGFCNELARGGQLLHFVNCYTHSLSLLRSHSLQCATASTRWNRDSADGCSACTTGLARTHWN